ncbi:hypothetical protein BsIDN1_14470 [Bacillus safensis]|uniref:Methyl-accepting transducer domain-containing protein n=1 Tax=Bacillus safensis TaxID=561879 RepID=A0A5S9M7C1_BACIA|nr:hypothetical protein BsIDN1_14470 [Bacillus safensis]
MVRKLAEQSADAAKTVSDLVIGTQENSQRVLESVEESSKAVEEGREQMEGTSQNFALILRRCVPVFKKNEQFACFY